MAEKKSQWAWVNPLAWIEAIATTLLSMLGALLRLFGAMPPPSVEGFENIQPSDVAAAAENAIANETKSDEAVYRMTPAEVVHAFARATGDERAALDLGNLTPADQDWLLALSDADLLLLGQSGIPACRRSLQRHCVVPSFGRLRRPEPSAPRVAEIPDERCDDEWKKRYVTARYRELLSSPRKSDPHLQSGPVSFH